MKRLATLLAALVLACNSFAKEAAPLADDPKVEARLTAIAEELRCLVCQNESLIASRADLAMDLKRQVRELIKAGKSDAEIREYLVQRYGDFVLYRPPVKSSTLLLWLGPFALAIAGFCMVWIFIRRRRAAGEGALTREQEARANELLANRAHDAGR